MGKQKKKRRIDQPSREQIEKQFVFRMRVLDLLQALGVPFVWLAGAVALAYVAIALPVIESHGQSTTISLAYDFLADVKVHIWLAWGAAAVCAMGWRRERSARLKERAEKDARIEQLEKAIDPARTSSGLSPSGLIRS